MHRFVFSVFLFPFVLLLTLAVWSTGKEVLRHSLTTWSETEGQVVSVQVFPDDLVVILVMLVVIVGSFFSVFCGRPERQPSCDE